MVNQHITTSFNYYLSQEKPEYAVLLSGKWGSGKTFLIDDFIKNHNTSQDKIIKISLFGLKNLLDIDRKIIFEVLDTESATLNAITKAMFQGIESLAKKSTLQHKIYQ